MTFEHKDEFKPKKKRKAEIPDAGTFACTQLGFVPDAEQMKVLRSEAKYGILNCSRQWGKSTVTAAKVLHRAFSRPESLVVVASPTERQSAEFLRKASEMLRRLGVRPRGDGDNACSLLLPNKSRIVGLPGTEATTRGFSASMVVIDEASRVTDEMYKSLRPMLAATNGDLWMMSTPYGKRGFFYDAWAGGDPSWMRMSVPATACPRIAAKFLEQERAAMGSVWFGQEYMCEFTGDGAGVFARDVVEAAMDDLVPELRVG